MGIFHLVSTSPSSDSSCPMAFSMTSVGIAPGATAFTVMSGANSADSVHASGFVQAFAAPL